MNLKNLMNSMMSYNRSWMKQRIHTLLVDSLQAGFNQGLAPTGALVASYNAPKQIQRCHCSALQHFEVFTQPAQQGRNNCSKFLLHRYCNSRQLRPTHAMHTNPVTWAKKLYAGICALAGPTHSCMWHCTLPCRVPECVGAQYWGLEKGKASKKSG